MFQRFFHPRFIAFLHACFVMVIIWKSGSFLIDQEENHVLTQKHSYYLHQLDRISQSLEKNFEQISQNFVPLYEIGLQNNQIKVENFNKISKKIIEIQPAISKILFFDHEEVKFGYPETESTPLGAKLILLPRSHQFYITDERLILRYPYTNKQTQLSYFIQFEINKNAFFQTIKKDDTLEDVTIILKQISNEFIWSNYQTKNVTQGYYSQVLKSQPIEVFLTPKIKVVPDMRVAYFLVTLAMLFFGLITFFLTKNGVLAFNQYIELKEKLKNEEDKIKLVTNILSVPILITREDGAIEFVNQEFMHVFGLGSEEKCIFNVTNLYANPLERFHILELLQTEGRISNYQLQAKRFDNHKVFWINLSIRKIILNNQVAFVSSLFELEEQKFLEQKLKKTENYLNVLFSSANDYVIHRVYCVPNEKNQYEFVLDLISPSAINILGLSDDEMYDIQQWKTRVHPNELERISQILFSAMQSQQAIECSFRWYHQIKRRWIYIKLSTTPLFDETNNLLFYNGVIVDITDQKIEEERLEQGQRELERAVQDRTYALSVVNSKLIAELGEHQYIERKLLEDHQFCNYVLDNAPLFLLTFDKAQQIGAINETFSRLTGFRKDQLYNTKIFYYLMYPDQEIRDAMQLKHNALKHGDIKSFVSAIHTQNGEPVSVLWLNFENYDKQEEIFFGVVLPKDHGLSHVETQIEGLKNVSLIQ